MTLISNKLQKQVDLPTWEWTRPLPVAATGGISCSCTPDAHNFNEIAGRYIYLLLNATNFWRYDTVTDTYMQLASPGITPTTGSSMRFAGTTGYYGRCISATSNTLTTGLPFSSSAVGYRIRLISGRGAGQERFITSVSDPVVADWGGATAATSLTLTDTSKNWGYTGSGTNVNGWVGYVLRVIGGTGINMMRKILHNTANVLTIADANIYAHDTWAVPMSPVAGTAGMTSPAAGTLYQIESSTITIDTPWDTVPDDTTRYVIQSGGIFLASGASVANGGATLQFYSILEDIWYAKSSMTNMIPIVLTDLSLERFTENSTLWETGQVTSATNTSITESTVNWDVNRWTGYKVYFWTGTGRGQVASVANNTATTLTFTSPLAVTPDSTTRYSILGYDAGKLTSSSGRVVFDSTKSWEVDRWKNYALHILSGTGDGQVRQIMSNGPDSLVLYDNWAIQPDNTTLYAIRGFSKDFLFTLGGNAETFFYRGEDADIVSHGRVLDEGIAQVACAIPTDGTDTSTHVIYEQKPRAITSISGTTTITATTVQPHQFKVGQWVSIRGVTSAAADVYNVTGKVQITSTPTATTFTYTPFAAGTGSYQYSNNVAVSASTIPDASKFHADLATGGSTTTVTFTRAQPSDINGWYVYGTNIGDGAQVVSGAGTTTLTLSVEGAGTPSGTIIITKWPRPVTATYSSGGGAGVFTMTLSSAVPAYVKGWLVTGTNIGVGAYITGGEGTNTISMSVQCSGVPSGTITFSHPCNNPVPTTSTYSSNSGTSISLSSNTASYITGWWVSGTNISNGTRVVGGAGSNTITLSHSTSGTPSGTITFYPPSQAGAMYYGTTAAPSVAAAGLLAGGAPMQLVAQNVNNGTILTPLSALAGATAGVTRFVIAQRNMIGMAYAGQNLNYLSGVAVGTQSTTTLVDTNSFWSTATGSGGSTGAFTFTLSAPGSPIHNGWFVSGTNIPTGARVVSGAGTTTITIDMPLAGAVSGTVTFTAWSAQYLTNRRLRVISGTGLNQEMTITAVTPTTGTLTFGAATAPGNGISSYVILPTIIPGTGCNLQWVSDTSNPNIRKGTNVFRFRGGATSGIDKIDMTTDQYTVQYTIPIVETLTTGTMYAYDQLDRIYFTKDLTNRVYYLDCNTLTIHGAGQFPYLAGTAGVGNKMEVFITKDGLKYLWINRQQQVETFRQLLFF